MSTYQALMIRKALKCSNCKYYQVTAGQKQVCSLIKFKYHFGVAERFHFAETNYVRKIETLCGPYAKYFEPVEIIDSSESHY